MKQSCFWGDGLELGLFARPLFFIRVEDDAGKQNQQPKQKCIEKNGKEQSTNWKRIVLIAPHDVGVAVASINPENLSIHLDADVIDSRIGCRSQVCPAAEEGEEVCFLE